MKTAKGYNLIPQDKDWEIAERKFCKTGGVKKLLKRFHRKIRRIFKKEIEKEINKMSVDYITEAEALSDIYGEDFLYEEDLYFSLLWKELKSKGYVWQDRSGKRYTAKNLKKDKRYLKNIINFAKDNDRPLEQIETLEKLLLE